MNVTIIGNPGDCWGNTYFSFYSPCRDLWVPATANVISFRVGWDRCVVYFLSGNGEAVFLQEGKILTGITLPEKQGMFQMKRT
jgi:hypothetical protein